MENLTTHSSIFAWRIPLDRGAWWATVHGFAKSRTRLSNQVHTHTHTHTQCLTGPAYLTEHAEPHLCRQLPRGPSSLFTPAPPPPPWPRVTVPNSAFSPLHRGPGTLTPRCPRAPPAGSCVRPSAQGQAAPTSQGGWVCLHP